MLAHEHRSRASALGASLRRWDEADEQVASFACALRRERLRLVAPPLREERPRMVPRGRFRSWTADVSVVEVVSS